MKKIPFTKYQATGNDFIVIDNRLNIAKHDNKELWKTLCKRKEGIGADGVLLLEKSDITDFFMRYINSDGSIADFCGNGARAIAHYYYHCLNNNNHNNITINTPVGVYGAKVDGDIIEIKMMPPRNIGKYGLTKWTAFKNSLFLNTGVPHAVFEVESNTEGFDLIRFAPEVRHDSIFPQGTNVNIFEVLDEFEIKIRTFEKGVEGETLSCGTGALACALAYSQFYDTHGKIIVRVKGGKLAVKIGENISNIKLSGKALKIYQGHIEF